MEDISSEKIELNNSENFIVFPWNSNLETGIKEIDNQHKKLVDLLNKLANTLVNNDNVEIEVAFKELAEYASYHFEEEEGIWYNHFKDDSWFESHQFGHASFLPKIEEIENDKTGKPKSEIIEQIIKFLIRWLAFHIIDNDKRMVFAIEYLKQGKTLDESKLAADRKMSGSMRLLIETILHMYDGLSSRTLELMRERIARKKAVKDREELIHILCHDLKNPLSHVHQSVQMIGVDNDYIKFNLDNLKLSIEHGINIIDRTRELFEDRNVDVQKVNLSKAIDESLVILEHQVIEKKIKIDCHCIPLTYIKANYTILVNSIVTNILTNAIKFSPLGGNILISFEKSDGKVYIKFKDEGIGLPGEMLDSEKIVVRTGTKEEKGSGIGLRLVKKYVRLFGGEITFASNNGTIVTLRFDTIE
ncbi:MAG: bacteriohemerythrin [Bacteroidales bacterium]|nr:bacteriohemerythrin [Bacteroidales bacterium]